MYYCTTIVSALFHTSNREANFRVKRLLRNERNVILQVLPWKLKIEHPYCINELRMPL
jgi:hypothetical protein